MGDFSYNRFQQICTESHLHHLGSSNLIRAWLPLKVRSQHAANLNFRSPWSPSHFHGAKWKLNGFGMCEIIKALLDVAFLVSANFGLHTSLPFPLPPEFFDSDRTWSSSMHGFSTRLKCNLIRGACTDLLGVLSSLIYAPMVWHSIRMDSLNLDRGVVCQEQSDYSYGYDTERRVGWFCRHSHAQTWYKPNPDVSYDSRFPMCVCV